MTAPLETPHPDEQASGQSLAMGDPVLLQTILSYFREAEMARTSGTRPRNEVWESNWEAYWANYDYSQKAEWQSRQRLPEVANFVERFAAEMRSALTQADPFYTVRDLLDEDQTLSPLVEKAIGVFLDRSGENETGQMTGFAGTFGEIVKSGALMALCASVTWENGRVRVAPVDPREVYLDPTGRGMYRIRKRTVDRHELLALAEKKDASGRDLYDREAILRLMAAKDPDDGKKDDSSGHTSETTARGRKPVVLLEFLGKITDADGSLRDGGRRQLVIVANEREIIRGPEVNPFRHGHDWLIYAPVLRVPFSVYHRTYVEGFKEIASAFNEFTNLLLDATQSASFNVFMAWLDALDDPTQVQEGIHPNKVFLASDSWPAGQDFVKRVETGDVPVAAISIWNGLKQELREGASQNELALGQLSSGEKTATEVTDARQGSRTLSRSIAEDIEDGFLAVLVELVWLTAVQHLSDRQDQERGNVSITDREILDELGPEIVEMIQSRRDEFFQRRLRYKVRGITGVLQKAQRVRTLISALGIVGGNDLLAQEFVKRFSVGRVLDVLLKDMNIDTERIEKTPEERQRDALSALASGTNGGAPGGGSSASVPDSEGPGLPLPGVPGGVGEA